jgi:hypothetical protein
VQAVYNSGTWTQANTLKLYLFFAVSLGIPAVAGATLTLTSTSASTYVLALRCAESYALHAHLARALGRCDTHAQVLPLTDSGRLVEFEPWGPCVLQRRTASCCSWHYRHASRFCAAHAFSS